MANTVIQLKWSESTSTPPSLNVAEPAYSNSSNKLFIGLSDNSVVAIGGKYYTDIIDAATSANTADKLVLRDANGDFSASNIHAELIGNALTATTLQTTRTISFSGDVDSVSNTFNGSGDISFDLELTNTGVSAGTYGGSANVPVFTVDVDGRITAASNVSVATNLSMAGDSGTDTVSLLTDTLTFEGGDGVTTTVSDNKVTINVDNTVIRTSGGQTIGGDLAITGNLVISGNTITQDVETIKTEDTLIKLGANNAADALDIGFYGEYNDGSTKYAGLVRDATDGTFKLFVDETTDPTDNVVTYDASNRATLDANFTGGNVSSLFSDIAVSDGGTGRGTFTVGSILIGNGTDGLLELSNTTSAGTYANASHVPVITVDDYGRVSSVTNTAIAVDMSALSGILSIARGGTNNDTYTTGGLIYYDGTSFASIANTTYTQTGTLSQANTITSITVDAYGRFTAATTEIIDIATTQISSGTLGVDRGGTGSSTFTTKGVIVSDNSSGTGALTALTSATEGHVLQINSSGVPTFAHLNGGSF